MCDIPNCKILHNMGLTQEDWYFCIYVNYSGELVQGNMHCINHAWHKNIYLVVKPALYCKILHMRGLRWGRLTGPTILGPRRNATCIIYRNFIQMSYGAMVTMRRIKALKEESHLLWESLMRGRVRWAAGLFPFLNVIVMMMMMMITIMMIMTTNLGPAHQVQMISITSL